MSRTASVKKAAAAWISAREARLRLGIGIKALASLGEQGHISTLRLPGQPPKYSVADVERILAASVKPATK